MREILEGVSFRPATMRDQLTVGTPGDPDRYGDATGLPGEERMIPP